MSLCKDKLNYTTDIDIVFVDIFVCDVLCLFLGVSIIWWLRLFSYGCDQIEFVEITVKLDSCNNLMYVYYCVISYGKIWLCKFYLIQVILYTEF